MACVLVRRTVVLALLSSSLAPGQNAAISGIVAEESGKPVPRIWVTAVRNGLPPASATVASSPDGTFTLRNLPPGDYHLCADSETGEFLDPCVWSVRPALSGLLPQLGLVSLQSARNSVGNRISLKRAAGSVIPARQRSVAIDTTTVANQVRVSLTLR